MKPSIPRPLPEPQLRSVMRNRPHRPFVTFIKSGLLLAMPVALIVGTSAMAAEIHDAVRTGDAATVARLLKKDAKLVNLPDDEHAATPLYHAVDTGNPELVGILLKAGAKVNVKTDGCMTPKQRAAAITRPECVAGLLKMLDRFVSSAPGPAKAASREALQAYQKSLVPGPEEEAARLAVLRLLVERDRSLLDADPDQNMTPLHVAAYFANRKAVEYLLEQGAALEAVAVGCSPLQFAAQLGNAEVVKVLIAHQAKVNAVHPTGVRPLHVAVINGDLATIRLLVEHGAEVNAVDKNGRPALHGATWSDEIFNLLLERGADPKLEAADGTTTLHMACQDGSSTLVAKLLLLHPDVDAWDREEYTPLLNAAEVGRVDLLKLLVAAGANLKAVPKSGRNALCLAAGSASTEAVRFLLDHQFGVNDISNSGETALMNAASHCRLETVTLLLRAGANVNGAEKKKGLTALMVAALGGRTSPTDLWTGNQSLGQCGPFDDSLKITALLLDKGADMRAKDRAGKGALHWAAAVGNVGVVELLLSKGAEVDAKDTLFGRTPLHDATYTADVKTVATLLAKGASLMAKDSNGCQPIHLATQVGNVEVLHLLLEKGAEVAATESHGGTPLHIAAASAKLEAVRVLLEHGAPPAALDQFKNTPLNMAATVGAVEIVRLLLDHRAPVNAADTLGNTPLHNAAIVRIGGNNVKPMAGQPEEAAQQTLNDINKSNAADKLKIVRLLLEKGAKPNAKNLEGATPINAAVKFGTPEILAALKSQAPPSRGK
ncbi:MAG: ankyrin repeat domain-containing protein [Verrucomicrobia bacterium]|nr:ankyrin repeat domain-containing protein [Verrucomicrobiota bacterium]